MNKILFLVAAVLALLTCAGGPARAQQLVGAPASADELLRQARAAVGSEAKLGEVKSLAAAAKFRRVEGGQEISGELEIALLLPDHFRRSVVTNLPGNMGQFTNLLALDGDQAWADARTSSPRAPVVILPDGQSAQEAQLALKSQARAQYAYCLLAWLLTTPASLSAEYSYAGEAVAEDGRADVLDVKGDGAFAARLFLDKRTHQLLMLSYREEAPPSFDAHVSNGINVSNVDRRPGQKTRPPASPTVEIQLRFSGFRTTDGLRLPYRVTHATDGQTDEEWNIESYQINPPLRPDKFKKL